MFTGGQVG